MGRVWLFFGNEKKVENAIRVEKVIIDGETGNGM